MRDAALALRGRLDGFIERPDPAEILRPRVLAEIEEVMAVPGALDDGDMAYVIAWLRWYRSLAAPGAEERQAEQDAAVALFERVYIDDPQNVPGPLQPMFARRGLRRRVTIPGPGTPPADLMADLNEAAERFQSFLRTNDRAMLDECVAGFRRVRGRLPEAHVLRPTLELILGLALLQAHLAGGDGTQVREAVACLRRGVETLPPRHEMRPAALMCLSGGLATLAMDTGDMSLLEEAYRLSSEADASATDGSPMAGLVGMAHKLMEHMRKPDGGSGSQRALDDTVEIARTLLRSAPSADAHSPVGEPLAGGHADRVQPLLHLGLALAARFGATGQVADLEEAQPLLREADLAAPADHSDRALVSAALGVVLSELSRRRGDARLSDEAVDLLMAGRDALPETHPAHPVVRANLAVALWQRHETAPDRAGRRDADLDVAILVTRDVLDLLAADSPLAPALKHNLATGLLSRYHGSGDVSALEESVELARSAVRSTPEGGRHRLVAMYGLCTCLRLRHRVGGDPADAAESLLWGRRLVQAAGDDDPERGPFMIALGQALEEHAAATGGTEDLDRAIDVFRQAPSGEHPHLGAAALGNALLARYGSCGEVADLEEAVMTLRAAGEGSPECLGLLGMALFAWRGHTKDRSLLREARDALTASLRERGAEETDAGSARPHGPAGQRVAGQVLLGRILADDNDWAGALEAYGAAVDTLPEMASRKLRRADRLARLRPLSGLAAEAAACALTAEQPERAVELLERGRGLLLSQQMEFRPDLDRLRAEAPDLVTRFESLRARLAAAEQAADAIGTSGRAAERVRALAAAWEELREQLTAAGGLGEVTGALSAAAMVAMADGGPVVYLNVGGHRSDALLLTPDGLDVVPLGLRRYREEAFRRAHLFQEAVASSRSDDLAVSGPARAVVEDTLGWLWETVAEPVIDKLGFGAKAGPDAGLGFGAGPGFARPRVWWCPGGPLAALPVHAARGPGGSALDLVVSSYTSTVRALRHGRAGRAPVMPPERVLAVGMSRTSGARPLDMAAEEARMVGERFREAKVLINEEATRDRVVAELARYPAVHLAGHAEALLDDPLGSRLLLHGQADRSLTVGDLLGLRLEDAGLAYLSACSTARGDPASDESVQLNSAFQLVGYRHVVGTMWEVDDRVSKRLAEAFYDALGGGDPARAVNAAARLLRDGGDVPACDWAAYVHLGI
jgi:hypothetical protein